MILEHRLFLGTADGSLLQYVIEEGGPSFSIKLVNSRKAVFKVAISAISILASGVGGSINTNSSGTGNNLRHLRTLLVLAG